MPPIVVHFKRNRLIGKAVIAGVLTTIFLSLTIGFYLMAITNIWLIGLCTLTTAWSAYHCALYIGVAQRNPVALRMDANGISGFSVEPATWTQIANIAIFRRPKGHAFVGISLQDPIGFRDGQTPWRRLETWFSGWECGFHFIVATASLEDVDVDQMVQQAKALHTAHNSQSPDRIA